ncbi:reverse transcriptase domain-containing protein [Tanacetum coccineum]|uniref:Reverse transcriptase domain-containing protein n=1 Tax=Tanacetum coccineum TaxID=301880 RepID=A0ABQ5J0L5_9ASTR
MVRKADGTCRMCIDFTSLNKACPNDSYPLPDMDQKIESLEGFKLKCFLDVYKGNHQIRMAREGEEKTSFHTKQGTFCYEKMPFELKNARATYQKLMDNMFTSQLGINIEIYVDDMCNNDAEVAFVALKTHLQSLPTLTIPKPGETLILYLAAAAEAISVVLLSERGNVQKPIYFVNRALQGSKINYPNLEKAIDLGEHEVLYKPRSAVKGQILADFLAKSPMITDSLEKTITDTPGKNTSPAWTLFTDGATILEGSGVGLILTDLNGQKVTYALRFNFRTSNNEGEYEALVTGLELAIKMEA